MSPMKITHRPSEDRGQADHGWLQAKHSFSFGDYQEPSRMGFGNLRVINEDRVAPGRGFATHGHSDMEILTYVLEGALAHRDSLGNASTILPSDVQRMSAGSGIRHSEVNPSLRDGLHLLQIWVIPHTRGIAPGYEQRHVSAAQKQGHLKLLASVDGREESVVWHADASLYAGLFNDGAANYTWTMPAGRGIYVHLARGELTVQGHALKAGDALTIVPSDARAADNTLTFSKGQHAEVLVFDAGPL
jgi:quercetin 2,3-dioxygenase